MLASHVELQPTIRSVPLLVKTATDLLTSATLMPMSKECPLCGELMRLRDHQAQTRIPGHPEIVSRTVWEWTCPECDYFEEAEEGGSSGTGAPVNGRQS